MVKEKNWVRYGKGKELGSTYAYSKFGLVQNIVRSFGHIVATQIFTILMSIG